MYNYIAFIMIVLFIPAVTFFGIKTYKPKNTTVIAVLTWIFFGCELLRFFYNASLYKADKAIQPSDRLTFTYLSIMSVLAMFSAFNRGKLSKILKSIFILSALTPLILGLFDSSIYTNPDDVHTVVKALYFVETGFVFALAMMHILDGKETVRTKQLIFALVFMCLYVVLNATARHFFTEKPFDTLWAISMVTIVAVTALVYLGLMLFGKKKTAKDSTSDSLINQQNN